jgi:hypothetical protein
MLSWNLFESMVQIILQWLGFLSFGAAFGKVLIFIKNFTFERNLLRVKGMKMNPII